MIEAQQAPFKPKLNKYRSADTKEEARGRPLRPLCSPSPPPLLGHHTHKRTRFFRRAVSTPPPTRHPPAAHTRPQDKRDFLTKMQEKIAKHRRDLEEARKQRLRDELGVGDPAQVRERLARENAFLRECLQERLRLEGVRTDPEAVAEYIRCGSGGLRRTGV